jgi:hypothetical protein
MRRSLCLCLTLGLLVFLAAAVGDAQGPPAPGDGKAGKSPAKGSAKGAGPEATPKRPSDKLKLPPGVTVLYDDLKDGMRGPPRGYFLTPEAYQELMDIRAQFERLSRPERRPPAECRLKLTVEGDFAQIQADFVLEAKQPRTTVLLGLRGAQLSEARLRPLAGDADVGLPFPEHGPAGYTILLEQPGSYRLSLSLKMPVAFTASTASRGAERGLDLGLPGAAVTSLNLELPYAVKEVRYNHNKEPRTERAKVPGTKQRRWEGLLPGAATSLGLSWQEPVGLPDAGPLLTARGQIVVRLEEQYVQTVAELTLQDLRGRAREWRLWLPPHDKSNPLDVKVSPPEGLRYELLPPDRKGPRDVHTLRLSEPTGEPIKVTVTVQHKRTLTRWPVGPFAVVDAYRQEGTIEVRASATARRRVRLQYVLAADVDERDPPLVHAPDLVAFFRYSKMPLPPPATAPAPKGPVTGQAPLEIETRTARGRVKTEVVHELRLLPAGPGLKVVVTTRIKARPLDEPVDSLDVQLPRTRPDALAPLAGTNPAGFPVAPPWATLELAADAVSTPIHHEVFPATLPWATLALGTLVPHEPEWLLSGTEVQFPDEQARAARRARVRLPAAPKDDATVVLKGEYTLPAGLHRIRLDLPRPLAIEDGGAQVKVEVVDRSLELLVQGPAGETPAPGCHMYTAALENAPAYVDLAWRPYRPELPVQIVSDLTFHERDAHARQQITFQFADRPPGEAAQPLRLPARARNLRVTSGGKLLPSQGREVVWVALRPEAAAGAPLVLEYDFLLPGRDAARKKERGPRDAETDEPRLFEVPLLWPEQATRAQTKVRLWSAAGTVPALVRPDPAELTWKDRGTEVVPGQGLPARVLLADGLGLPLFLRLDPAAPGLAGVAIDRALVQVTVDDEGTEHYRARFLLSKISAPHLDVRLPAASAALSVQVRLAGEPVNPEFHEGGRVVRLPLAPGLFKGPVVLEVSYPLPRNQPEPEGLWQTSLHPPEILGNVFLGRVRWQVALPGSWVPVVLGADAHPEQDWGWQGWLLAPEPALTGADLERWLTGQAVSDDGQLPSLVCSRTSLEPLRVLRLPRQLWLLACSGLLLLLGLGLYFAPLSHYSFWTALALLGVGAVVAAALWPAALPAVLYGCEPGAVVLALLLGFQWMLHQRYRRQVVFLPGFKRLKPGSSLLRGSSKRLREPSTVDEPAAAPPPAQGSSLKGG